MTNGQFFKDFFHFSRKDRVAAFVLLAILCLLIFVPYLYPKPKPSDKLITSYGPDTNTIADTAETAEFKTDDT